MPPARYRDPRGPQAVPAHSTKATAENRGPSVLIRRGRVDTRCRYRASVQQAPGSLAHRPSRAAHARHRARHVAGCCCGGWPAPASHARAVPPPQAPDRCRRMSPGSTQDALVVTRSGSRWCLSPLAERDWAQPTHRSGRSEAGDGRFVRPASVGATLGYMDWRDQAIASTRATNGYMDWRDQAITSTRAKNGDMDRPDRCDVDRGDA